MRVLVLLAVAVFGWNVEQPPAPGWRRVITDIHVNDGEPHWMSPESVATLIDFVDITDHQDWKVYKYANETRRFPDSPTQQAQVAQINSLGSTAELQRNLEELESFTNRYYTTFGAQSAVFLHDLMATYIQQSGRTDATVEYFQHSWAQPSVIARIVGSNPGLGRIIVGAHEDSINHSSSNKPQARAPGADDDGSGTVSVIESFRMILNSGFQPTRTIEFQLYAAEEVGLLGSAAIAQAYAAQGIPIHGMLQLDMNAYCANRNLALTMRQVSVDPALSNFLVLLIREYSSMTEQNTNGSFNSDHGSFTRSGYAACHTKESGGYPYIHTANDLAFRMNYACALEFSNIANAFIVELNADL